MIEDVESVSESQIVREERLVTKYGGVSREVLTRQLQDQAERIRALDNRNYERERLASEIMAMIRVAHDQSAWAQAPYQPAESCLCDICQRIERYIKRT